MQVAKGVNLAIDAAVAALMIQARPVHTEDDLAAVAATVIRDPELAAVIGEMSYLLGPEAHVSIEKFVAPYLQQLYHPGANYRATIASMYLYTDEAQRRSILPNGVIALVDGKLETSDEIVAILDAALKAKAKSLTVIAGHFSDEVIGIMVANNRQTQRDEPSDDGQQKPQQQQQERKLAIVGATPKDVGDARRSVYDDLGMLTGATVTGREWSKPAAMILQEDLGQVTRSEVTKDMFHVVPRELTSEVRAKAAELRSRLSEMNLDDDDRPDLLKRLAAMSGGMGVLKIGADSKLDREVQAQNAERALKVLSGAQRSGVVPGGGATLLQLLNVPFRSSFVFRGRLSIFA
jgi:chaperonin GroEL